MAERGHNDEHIAGLAGVDRGTISRVRRGVNRPSWDLADKIAILTDGLVTPNDFLPAPPPGEQQPAEAS